ncbi:MAG: response regulator [Chloroflexi bacterium]|nr:response regulator [Chloroflexota bacterium]
MNVTPKVRLLLVDGDRRVRELVRENFSSERFDVLEASTAWDCLKMASRESPDVMILDLHLPDHDGWELLSLAKLLGILDDTEVVITSPDPPSATAVNRARLAGFVRKPIDVRQLVQRVDRAVAGRRAKTCVRVPVR